MAFKFVYLVAGLLALLGRVDVYLSGFRRRFVFPVSPRFLWECHNICSMVQLVTHPSQNRTGAINAYGSS